LGGLILFFQLDKTNTRGLSSKIILASEGESDLESTSSELESTQGKDIKLERNEEPSGMVVNNSQNQKSDLNKIEAKEIKSQIENYSQKEIKDKISVQESLTSRREKTIAIFKKNLDDKSTGEERGQSENNIKTVSKNINTTFSREKDLVIDRSSDKYLDNSENKKSVSERITNAGDSKNITPDIAGQSENKIWKLDTSINQSNAISPNLLNRILSNVDLLLRIEPLLTTQERSMKPLSLPDPIIILRNRKRWSVFAGLSIRNEYEVGNDLNSLTNRNKIRLTQLGLKYNLLNKGPISSSVTLAYNRIFGGEEFNGSRITRVYEDDNLSLGYHLQSKLFRSLGLEVGAGVGISYIKKHEFEQKPVWVDGAQEFKDYTKTSFEMLPTPTYQFQGKLNYMLSSRIALFTEATYRSQFQDRLRTNNIVRENTLRGFADLQFSFGAELYIK